MRRTRFSVPLAIAVALGAAGADLTGAGPALAQIPGGIDPAQVQHMLPSQIEVPAGQSTSVDVGVPVSVGYAAGGWNISAAGSTVTVAAPDQPGATASVPVSAGGYSTTVTLVAVGAGEAEAGAREPGPNAGGPGQPDPGRPNPGEGRPEGQNSPVGSGSATSPGEVRPAQVQHPERKPASTVNTSNAVRLNFDGTIAGNVLTVRVSLAKAQQLMQYIGMPQDGAKLRYVDVNGRIIEGVQRNIDAVSRTLTLTYPEGQTPDNPFIMEVVRDDTTAEFLAVITARNAPVEVASDPGTPYAAFGGTPENSDGNTPANHSGSPRSWFGPAALAGVAAVALLAAFVALARRRRNHRRVSSKSTR
ncbi:hypothetical protein [Corynebacterium sp. UBA2622]|uniref:hypothetical protein n=1 Tax=Corynebacterium sp. UBA2622 TaxID=1946393 RepID=UPI0025C460C3|nr:hypothetical protein [Corynebacterium sp. UBA2622]